MKNNAWFRLMLCVLAALPGAFFGICVGSGIGYNREYTTARRTHTFVSENHLVLRQCEAIGALLGALPGAAVGVLLWLRAKPPTPQRRRSEDVGDGTVWPTPPEEG